MIQHIIKGQDILAQRMVVKVVYNFPQSSITKNSTKKRRGGDTRTGVSQQDMHLGKTNNERKS